MPRNGNLNWYDPMPADYGDNGEIKSLVGTPVAPEPVKEDAPVKDDEEKDEEKESAPAKRGRPAAKKTAPKVEDEQGTTAKN